MSSHIPAASPHPLPSSPPTLYPLYLLPDSQGRHSDARADDPRARRQAVGAALRTLWTGGPFRGDFDPHGLGPLLHIPTHAHTHTHTQCIRSIDRRNLNEVLLTGVVAACPPCLRALSRPPRPPDADPCSPLQRRRSTTTSTSTLSTSCAILTCARTSSSLKSASRRRRACAPPHASRLTR